MKKLLFFILPLFFFFSCDKHTQEPKALTVAVSLPPYTYFVKRIAGDTVTVVPIVPAQSNPHVFEPTPKQVLQLKEASLWLRSREGFENKIINVLKDQNPNLAIVDLSENLPDEEEDRHIWLSPRQAREQALLIADALIELNPDSKKLYLENLNLFLDELQKVDEEIAALLSPYKDQAILTSHPAFGFFCKDYGLVQLSIECEGKDPLPKDLENTLEQAKVHKVASILIQPQYNNRGAEVIATHLGLPVYSIDPYSTDYFKNLRHITSLISKNDH